MTQLVMKKGKERKRGDAMGMLVDSITIADAGNPENPAPIAISKEGIQRTTEHRCNL